MTNMALLAATVDMTAATAVTMEGVVAALAAHAAIATVLGTGPGTGGVEKGSSLLKPGKN